MATSHAEIETSVLSRSTLHLKTSAKPEKSVLKRYLSEVLCNLPDDAQSTEPSRIKLDPKPKRKIAKRRTIRSTVHSKRPSMSPPVSPSQTVSVGLASPHRRTLTTESKPRTEADKKKRDQQATGLGELMEVMHKRKGIVLSNSDDIEKFPHLHSKIFEMLQTEPQEVHRIVEAPHYVSARLKTQGVTDVEEWAEEHETAYKSIMRKSTSFSTVAKTMRFKELAKELPEKRTYLNEEWKYDQRSPWVNDLDYHSPNYFEVLHPPKINRKSISNIRISSPDFSVETKQDLELKSLQQELGKPSEPSLTKLKRESNEIKKVQDFNDAMACFESIPKWEKSPLKFEKAKQNLTDYLIGRQLIEMKKLNLARYTYLSSKIASQRAKLEFDREMLAKAEERRKDLRRRQMEFQRVVTIMRAVVRQKYGSHYAFKPRRLLLNTAAKQGSPLFLQNMIKLGYLPNEVKPEPQRQKPGGQVVVSTTNLQVSPKSTKNLSKFNKVPMQVKPNTNKLTKNHAAMKIQATLKGWLWRKKLARMKKAARLFQRGFRRYKAWKCFIKFLIIQQLRQPTPRLKSLLFRFSRSSLFKKALKEVKSSKMSGLDLGNLKRQTKTGAIKPEEPPMPIEDQVVKTKIEPMNLPVVNIVHRVEIGNKRKLSNISITVKCMDPIEKTFYDLDDYERSNLLAEAADVNDLIRGIARARSEMWRIYLSSVTKSSFTDEDVLKVMAKSSLYAQKQKANGRSEELLWKDSFFLHPIFKSFNLALVTPQDLYSHDLNQVKSKLRTELDYAHRALELTKEKYASALVNMHQFDSAVSTSLGEAASNIVIPRLLPETKYAQEYSLCRLIIETLKNKFDEVESLKSELSHLITSGRHSP